MSLPYLHPLLVPFDHAAQKASGKVPALELAKSPKSRPHSPDQSPNSSPTAHGLKDSKKQWSKLRLAMKFSKGKKSPMASPKSPTRAFTFNWDHDEQDFLKTFVKRMLSKQLFSGWQTWKRRDYDLKMRLERLERLRIMDNMRKILKQSAPGARGKEELDGIKKWALTVHGDILKLLKEDQLDQFAQWASFAELPEKKLLFLQGQMGQTYWICLKGSAEIYVEDDGMEEQRKLSMLRSPDKGKEFIEGMCEESFDILGRSVFTVVEGKGFGEVALFSENSKRTATAITTCASEFICLDKPKYMRTLSKYHKVAWETQQKRQYFKKVPLFDDWTSRRLTDMSYSVVRQKYPRGALLVRQGTIPDSLQFICSGNVRVVRRLTEKECGMDTAEKAMYPRLADVTIDLGIRGEFDVIGPQAALRKDGMSKEELKSLISTCSVIATSAVEVFAVPASKIATLRSRCRGTMTLNLLRKIHNSRIEAYRERVHVGMSSKSIVRRMPAAQVSKISLPKLRHTGPPIHPNMSRLDQTSGASSALSGALSAARSEEMMVDAQLRRRTRAEDDIHGMRMHVLPTRKVRSTKKVVKTVGKRKVSKGLAYLQLKEKRESALQVKVSRRKLALDVALDQVLNANLELERQKLLDDAQ